MPEEKKKGAEKEEEGGIWRSKWRQMEFLKNQVELQQGMFSFRCNVLYT